MSPTDDQAIRDLTKTWTKAVQAADVDALFALVTEDGASAQTTHTDGKRSNV